MTRSSMSENKFLMGFIGLVSGGVLLSLWGEWPGFYVGALLGGSIGIVLAALKSAGQLRLKVILHVGIGALGGLFVGGFVGYLLARLFGARNEMALLLMVAICLLAGVLLGTAVSADRIIRSSRANSSL